MNRLLVTVSLLAAGCGGSSISLDDYFTQTTQAQCDFEVKCCGSVPNAVVYTSVDQCVTTHSGDNATAITLFKSSIAAGKLRYDATAAKTCLDRGKSLASSCTSTIDATEAKSLTDACDQVFVLTAKVGEPCDGNDGAYACGDGHDYCATTGSSSAGTCTKPPAQGGDCSSDGFCAEGLYCDDTSTTCQPLKAKGTTCAADYECATGSCGSAGTCADATPLPVTESCDIMQSAA